MEMDEIRAHWTELAKTKGDSLGATTRTKSIKKLEIDVLSRWIKKKGAGWKNILEVGCGNGTNCIELGKLFPDIHFYGVDYINEMIANAKIRAKTIPNVTFDVDDATTLKTAISTSKKFNAIITDRCLINLNTIELQKSALKNIFTHLDFGGYYFMLENSVSSYANQNKMRELVGLKKRLPAEFNCFLDDDVILEYLRNELSASLEIVDNFASLHDLMLYVIEPSL